jgi:hypothetical protein
VPPLFEREMLAGEVIQSWFNIRTNPVIKPSILAITGLAINIRTLDIEHYRVAILSRYRDFPVIGRPEIGIWLWTDWKSLNRNQL